MRIAVDSIFHSPIKQDVPVWHELIQKIEIRDITRYHGPAIPTALQVDESVIETFSLRTGAIAAKPKHQAAQDSRLSPSRRVGRHEAMCGNVADCSTDCLERIFCSRIIRFQPTERMSEFGEANRRVIARSHGNEGVERIRRPSLKSIDVHSRVEQNRPTYRRYRLDPVQSVFRSAAKRRSLPARL